MVPRITLSVAALLYATAPAHAFWRMSCNVIQQGRIDPITDPGKPSGHVHKIAGASNIGVSSTQDTLMTSKCTSCSVQDDKSAYWTPQLYYQHGNGTYQSVDAGGMTVYYLGRGDDRDNIVPFPKGFRSLSGDKDARAYDPTKKTYKDQRPISDRVSYACLADSPSKETPGMSRTDCSFGLRAQVHFPSCWDGVNLYKEDQSHTAYMSGIDGGACPPTHPKLLPHIFFEVLYAVKKIDQSAGGKFVFSQGDATGFGFHGDFMNGWDDGVLTSAIKQCINTNNGQVEACAPLAKSQDKDVGKNCPMQPPAVLPQEKVVGFIEQLPGGNMASGTPPTGTTGTGGGDDPDGSDTPPVGGTPNGKKGGASPTPSPNGGGASPTPKKPTSSSTKPKATAHARDFAVRA